MKAKINEVIVAQLQQVRGMDALVGWLNAKLDDRRDDLVFLSGDNLLRAQGRAQELKEILETIHNSPDTARKIKK
jgi:hypothetical protein